ncbi:hypothetical protein FOLKNPGA_01744 [Legionella sp. PC1000]|uniref:hypothetical protein n=1 Tax=Legionella sp. PC1000 TaxID=2746060 RepID=UPI0015FB5D07|nr:hypothetical protein [Legionella sp. PC1000]QLZ68964.1 hypothetical protein FOLKNPGA_01744 [Legionella sp. PC1000]
MIDDTIPLKKRFNLPIKHQVTDGIDKFGFFAAFFLGLIGISCLKLLNCSQSWVTLFPVTIMVLYSFLIYSFLRFRLNEDQAGDNLYYLGFLFTLISLAFALYQFDSNGGTAIIIENFGIALATTITGLFLRILFNQMRHDPVEIEREARMELTNAASRLRTNLLEVTEIMKSTLIAAQQQTAEVMQDYGKRFDDVAHTIIEKTNEVHSTVIENTNRLKTNTNALVESVENLLDRINKIETPSNILEEKLAPAIESIRMAGEEIAIRAKGDELTIKQLTKIVKNAINSSVQLEDKVKLLNDQSEKIYLILSNIDTINSQFEQSGTRFHEAAEKVARLSEVQTLMQDTINTSLNNITKTSSTIISKYSESTNEAIEAQKSTFKELELTLNGSLKITQTHNEKLAEELKRSREYTEKVHHSLVEMTDSLTQKIANENHINTSNVIGQ